MTVTGTDIYGNETSGKLDVSDDALADKWEPDSTQSEPVSDEEDGNQSDEDEESEEEDPSEDEDQSEEEEEPSSDDFDLPEKLKGKSESELAKMYVELERRFGKEQSAELGDLRRLVEAQQQQLQQMQQQTHSGSDEIADYITDTYSASAIYQQAIEALSQGKIDVSVVDDIIDATHEIDPRLALKMNRDFGLRLSNAQNEEKNKPYQQSSYDTNLRHATNELYEDPKFKDDVKAYQKEIVALVQGKNLGSTSSEIRSALEQVLIYARGEDPTKSIAYRNNLAASKQNSQVEEGSSETAPIVTEEEALRKRVFEKRSDSGENNIFAGFGGK